ncbi:MAG TPA: hypothetical protein VFT01_04200, partial [Homoserinimonas sp.]|nr:hypothetical protein [Homoserinimonas sp.]
APGPGDARAVGRGTAAGFRSSFTVLRQLTLIARRWVGGSNGVQPVAGPEPSEEHLPTPQRMPIAPNCR